MIPNQDTKQSIERDPEMAKFVFSKLLLIDEFFSL